MRIDHNPTSKNKLSIKRKYHSSWDARFPVRAFHSFHSILMPIECFFRDLEIAGLNNHDLPVKIEILSVPLTKRKFPTLDIQNMIFKNNVNAFRVF